MGITIFALIVALYLEDIGGAFVCLGAGIFFTVINYYFSNKLFTKAGTNNDHP